MNANTAQKPRLRVGGVPEHYNLPWHLMMESDAYADLAVEVEWVDTHGGTGETKGLLEDGELDLAVALTDGMMKAIAAGNPSKILRTFVSTPLHWGVHVGAHRDLDDMAQFAGHRFAISRFGSGSHLMAHVLADVQGFEVEDASFVPVGNLAGARKALAADEAEIFLWDRSTTSPYVENGEFSLVGTVPSPWSAFVVVGRSDVIAGEHAAAITEMLDLVAKMAAELASHEDRVSIVAERYKIDPQEVAAWFDETAWDCAGPTDLEMVAAAQERLVALGLIEETHLPSSYVLNA